MRLLTREFAAGQVPDQEVVPAADVLRPAVPAAVSGHACTALYRKDMQIVHECVFYTCLPAVLQTRELQRNDPEALSTRRLVIAQLANDVHDARHLCESLFLLLLCQGIMLRLVLSGCVHSARKVSNDLLMFVRPFLMISNALLHVHTAVLNEFDHFVKALRTLESVHAVSEVLGRARLGDPDLFPGSSGFDIVFHPLGGEGALHKVVNLGLQRGQVFGTLFFCDSDVSVGLGSIVLETTNALFPILR